MTQRKRIRARQIIDSPVWLLSKINMLDQAQELLVSGRTNETQIFYTVMESIDKCDTETASMILHHYPNMMYYNDMGETYDNLPELFPHESAEDYLKMKSGDVISNKNDHDWYDDEFDTVLHKAIRQGCMEMIKTLIKKHDVDVSHHNNRALRLAEFFDMSDVVELIKKHIDR